MHTLLYLKRITNKALLHSTGNSAQCYVTAWMGEGLGGKCIHTYAWLGPLSCSPETIPTLLIFYVKCESCSVVSDSLWPHTVHGILQARILEWVAIPFSMGLSQSRDQTQTQISHIAGRFFTCSWATREAHHWCSICQKYKTLWGNIDKPKLRSSLQNKSTLQNVNITW